METVKMQSMVDIDFWTIDGNLLYGLLWILKESWNQSRFQSTCNKGNKNKIIAKAYINSSLDVLGILINRITILIPMMDKWLIPIKAEHFW